MESNNPKVNSADEIEVTQFFRWIGDGFRNLGDSILLSLATLRNVFFRNKIFFLIMIALGLCLGFFYSTLLRKDYYKSSMILGCDYLNTRILENTIEKLNMLCNEPKRESLINELHIAPEIAKTIAGFEFERFVTEDELVEIEVLREQLNNLAAEKKELVDKVIKTIEIENQNAFQITVLVYDPEVIKKLEPAIVNYFGNNPYVKRRVEISKTTQQSRKEKLALESARLDSLKSIIYKNYQGLSKNSKGSNNVIVGEDNITDPLAVFEQGLKVNQELLNIERNIYLQPEFELVDGFTTIKQPANIGLTTILVIAFFGSIAAGYLIIGVWTFDRVLANYPTKDKR